MSPFISSFIFPISSANVRELKPTRHIPATSDSMIFFIGDLLVNNKDPSPYKRYALRIFE
jgi:hypothetical protein